MKVLLILILIYLIYRFIRNITFFMARSRKVYQDNPPEPDITPAKKTKMIDKDEGEYVDYEEMKK
jgi:hypothetical protein